MAHAFHTHILDSCATKLSAEVFQVKYNKTDGPTSQILERMDAMICVEWLTIFPHGLG